MRMKDVCSRTGLTDRAVRLYIDSGLLFPQEEISYTGRRSINFSEEDAAALEVIATLRSAGFSIADIRTMQDTPETIPAVLARHRTAVETEILEKQAVLQKLPGFRITMPCPAGILPPPYAGTPPRQFSFQRRILSCI